MCVRPSSGTLAGTLSNVAVTFTIYHNAESVWTFAALTSITVELPTVFDRWRAVTLQYWWLAL